MIGLSGNKIEDLTPLVNNPYLNEEAFLYIGNNPLNEDSINECIPTLKSKGVNVIMM